MNKENYELKTKESNESIQTWINRNYISNELRSKLSTVDILIVPDEGFRDNGNLHTFPEGTESLFQFIKNADTKGHSIDICIEDKDYQELALHFDLITIANLVAEYIAAPVIVLLIDKYLDYKLGREKDSGAVKSKLTIHDQQNNKSIEITYEGPAATYESTMLNAIRNAANTPSIESSQTQLLCDTNSAEQKENND